MILPSGPSPAESLWGAVFTYKAPSYASDADAATTDYDALLSDMQAHTREANAFRAQQGL